MWHTILITAHAVTATIALVAGIIAAARARLFGLYLAALVAMEAFLVLAVGAAWASIDDPTRILFLALTGLGAVVLWRGVIARQVTPRHGRTPCARCVANFGFTLVALVDAFLVLTVLDAGVPGPVVATTGVVVVVIGHLILRVWQRRIALRPASSMT